MDLYEISDVLKHNNFDCYIVGGYVRDLIRGKKSSDIDLATSARPNDILKVSPIINSVFVNHNFVWGDSPILRWYTNNTKKIISNGNISYGKIEPNYRKTDGFMAMVNAMILAQTEIKERVKAPKVGVLTF